jgi:hypothetical protein
MKITYHHIGTPITIKPNDYAWFAMNGWKPDKIIPGAIKIGSRWQPIKARCIATRAGYFDHYSSVCAVEEHGYPTMKAAVKAARAVLEG